MTATGVTRGATGVISDLQGHHNFCLLVPWLVSFVLTLNQSKLWQS